MRTVTDAAKNLEESFWKLEKLFGRVCDDYKIDYNIGHTCKLHRKFRKISTRLQVKLVNFAKDVGIHLQIYFPKLKQDFLFGIFYFNFLNKLYIT